MTGIGTTGCAHRRLHVHPAAARSGQPVSFFVLEGGGSLVCHHRLHVWFRCKMGLDRLACDWLLPRALLVPSAIVLLENRSPSSALRAAAAWQATKTATILDWYACYPTGCCPTPSPRSTAAALVILVFLVLSNRSLSSSSRAAAALRLAACMRGLGLGVCGSGETTNKRRRSLFISYRPPRALLHAVYILVRSSTAITYVLHPMVTLDVDHGHGEHGV